MYLAEQLKPQQVASLDAYRASIPLFVRDVLGVNGDPPYHDVIHPYQEDILDALLQYRRVSVRAPHGAGKTAIAAWVVLWVMAVHERDVKAVTTASAWRQLTKFLWPEIHKWANRANWAKVGLQVRLRRELNNLSFKLPGGREAFAAASNTPDAIEGAHANTLLYLFDESKAIPDPIFDAAEGAFMGAGADVKADAYALAISTPGDPVGRFYDIQSRAPGTEDWYVRHVTLRECIQAGRISRDRAGQLAKLWGVRSPIFQRRVLGNFAANEQDSLIPLSWVEAAVERWHEWQAQGGSGEFVAVGVDVGRTGDPSVLALRYGNAVANLRYYRRKSTMVTAGHVKGVLDANGGQAARAVVDVIGIGAGVVDRLREQGYNRTESFNASAKAKDRRGEPIRDSSGELTFLNKRALAWWRMRELLDPDNGHGIALPPDDRLIGDLTAPRWTTTSTGAIKVESKEEVAKRISRSTDAADAVIQSFEPPVTHSKGFW